MHHEEVQWGTLSGWRQKGGDEKDIVRILMVLCMGEEYRSKDEEGMREERCRKKPTTK